LHDECARCKERGGYEAWPQEAREAMSTAAVCCWRQAALEPLRASPQDPFDWPRFVQLVSTIPQPARATLLPELAQLTHPAGKLCSCQPAPSAAATAWASTAKTSSLVVASTTCHGTGTTCEEVRRRVVSYRVHHPADEIVAPLRALLRHTRPWIPLPAVLTRSRQQLKPDSIKLERGPSKEGSSTGKRRAAKSGSIDEMGSLAAQRRQRHEEAASSAPPSAPQPAPGNAEMELGTCTSRMQVVIERSVQIWPVTT